ncbi:DUF4157 domain-containing protein [Dyella choica]|uniref:DUF4157 domain-containing protein n=2 Tax=Dyella choica TaxID=1927959 RepID=A0A432LY97_9GAMM|nr:DUF4157 domain-containing protein [Dyella choica]
MLAQRRALQSTFGSAFQLKADAPEKHESMQARAAPVAQQAPAVDPGAMANETGMPHQLKAGIEALSGMDMSDVRVHRNSDKPSQLNALAYAQGNNIHLGPGQERHLPHEAWHVVQQRQGRVQPTMQMAGAHVNDDERLEREADTMGAKALQRMSGSRLTATLESSPASSSQAAIQRIRVGYVPTDPAAFRRRTNILGAPNDGIPQSDKNFNESQKELIYLNNFNGPPPSQSTINVSEPRPTDDSSGAMLINRKEVTKIEPEIDHIVPKDHGGSNDFRNGRVLSKANNTNTSTNRPSPTEKELRLYEPIWLSGRMEDGSEYPEEHLVANATLTDLQASLLAKFSGYSGSSTATGLGKEGANAICRAPLNATQNNVRVSNSSSAAVTESAPSVTHSSDSSLLSNATLPTSVLSNSLTTLPSPPASYNSLPANASSSSAPTLATSSSSYAAPSLTHSSGSSLLSNATLPTSVLSNSLTTLPSPLANHTFLPANTSSSIAPTIATTSSSWAASSWAAEIVAMARAQANASAKHQQESGMSSSKRMTTRASTKARARAAAAMADPSLSGAAVPMNPASGSLINPLPTDSSASTLSASSSSHAAGTASSPTVGPSLATGKRQTRTEDNASSTVDSSSNHLTSASTTSSTKKARATIPAEE